MSAPHRFDQCSQTELALYKLRERDISCLNVKNPGELFPKSGKMLQRTRQNESASSNERRLSSRLPEITGSG